MKSILLVFLLLPAAVFAQNGGTIESRYGIGELDLMATSRQRAMGAVSAALSSPTDVSLTNPAGWSLVSELRLEGGITFEHITMERGDASSTSGVLKGFQFVFPLEDSWKLSLGTAVLPVSRSSYKTTAVGEIDGESYTTTYEGSGGLSLFRAGLALEPLPHLRIGAAYQYYFGTIEQDWELRFDNGVYYTSRQTRATGHSGSGFLTGLLYDGIKGLTIGISLHPAASLRASRNLLEQTSIGDSIINGASGTQDYPMLMQVGAAYQLSDKFLVAAEYATQDWTEATVFDRKQNQLGLTYKIGAGVEWSPYKNELGYRALAETAFRCGFYMQQPYLSINDAISKEYFITAGAGFPIFGGNRGDIALEYGWRNSDSDMLGSQNILRASITISVGESWFIRNRE
jgi:long-subunit fatty acid transport protein